MRTAFLRRPLTPWLALAVLPLLLCLPSSHAAPPPASAVTSGGGVRAHRGEAVFKQYCVNCHNKQPGDTSPFGPPDLNTAFHGPKPLTVQQASQIISNGKGRMPAWKGILTDAQISDVIAYLRTR